MRKIYFLGCILLFLFLSCLDNQITSDHSATVFREANLSWNRYYLSFSKRNCTSKTLFLDQNEEEISIRRVYPVNRLAITDPKIEKQLSSFSYSDAKTLEEAYIRVLEQYGLEEDILKVEQYGVLLDKIEIKATYEALQRLLKRYPDLVYSYYLESGFFF